MRRFKAFTLAEVLITLGVIGVVAAITMPTLIKNYQKHKTVNQLKKVYTVLNQAFKMSEIDNDAYENWNSIVDMGGKDYTEKYWQPYLKVVKTCSNFKDCGYKSETPWMNLNNTKEAAFSQLGTIYCLITNDGTLLVFAFYNNNHVVAIDVNGASNPNQYGKDLFLYRISKNGVKASGTSSTTQYCSKTHTRGDNGEYCSGKIMVDGWKIKDDYPW